MRRMARLIPIAVGVALAAGLCACDQKPRAATSTFNKRAVVLSPALTQIIVDLGKADTIVGVGQYDPLADRFPVVGDLNNVDYEKLIALDPTDVFLQPPSDGAPVKLLQLAGDHGWIIHTYSIDTIADVKEAIYNLRDGGVGSALGARNEALDLIESIDRKLIGVGTAVNASTPVSLVMLVGLNPITAAGQHTFLNEMILWAGGDNLITDASNPYPVLDKERLVTLRPDVVVIADPLDGPPAAIPDWLADLDIPAAKEGRILFLRDRQALLPSSTVPRITAKLAKLLHPDLAAQIDQVMAEDRDQ